MFLADENIPFEVVQRLRADKIDIISISEINPGMTDNDIIHLARRKHRTIITFDKDFGALVFKNKKQSYGVILLRLHPQSIEHILEILKKILDKNIDFKHSFCVVDNQRLRVVPLREYFV